LDVAIFYMGCNNFDLAWEVLDIMLWAVYCTAK